MITSQLRNSILKIHGTSSPEAGVSSDWSAHLCFLRDELNIEFELLR